MYDEADAQPLPGKGAACPDGEGSPAATDPTPREVDAIRRPWVRLRWIVLLGLVVSIVAGLLVYELRSSRLQAWYLSRMAQRCTFQLESGVNTQMRYPEAGPYDLRLGYARLPRFIERLTAEGFVVEAQARSSEELVRLIDSGLFAIYREKTQAGLQVLDREGRGLFVSRHPERVYPDFASVPPLVVQTLLFIENRELFDAAHPRRNPAIEWDRLAKAVIDNTLQTVRPGRDAAGGSTLATQMEKFRHSPEGRTTSPRDKLRQVVSASLRAYLDGNDTLESRRRLVVDYINSIPLAALPGYGEVNGLGDGLWTWHGVELDEVNRHLGREIAAAIARDPSQLTEVARAYKQVLSLFLAHRRPSYYLVSGRPALDALADRHLHLLSRAGVITEELRDAALAVPLEINSRPPLLARAPFAQRKAAQAIRARLLPLLDLRGVYDLDRLDLTVTTTFDASAQREVSRVLQELKEPAVARAAGLYGDRLLGRGDPTQVIYSFTLYERSGDRNVLRVQTDNFDKPLNINEGVKLELGSTAKLRTLVTYLEIVAALHAEHGTDSAEALQAIDVAASDRLTRWALEWLQSAEDRSLMAMLRAAMERRYSASPAESYFTGGGRHVFRNFNATDDDRVVSVREAFDHSINLPFIRLMRDIVAYYMFRVPGSSARVLEDAADPARQLYLSRFADREGRQFLERFARKYAGLTREEAFDALLADVEETPKRLAAAFRSVDPDATQSELAEFLRGRLGGSELSARLLLRLFEEHDPQKVSLVDRGHVARVHPLELWVVAHLARHPEASLAQLVEASAEERQQVYFWLFQTNRRRIQDSRIRSLLEVEAFLEIHRSWRRQGYPFGSLVPSLATAIGSSADRPAALAELVGIMLADGVRYPIVRIEGLRFGEGTPYDTQMARQPEAGERVVPSEVASVVREALLGVVERGTARRVHGAVRQGAEGARVAIGGKTGTGDNRFFVFGPTGAVIRTRVVNRTATFVFFIGERFFGTVTAFVPGAAAEAYTFTSSLPAQLLKHLAPHLDEAMGLSLSPAVATPEDDGTTPPDVVEPDESSSVGREIAAEGSD